MKTKKQINIPINEVDRLVYTKEEILEIEHEMEKTLQNIARYKKEIEEQENCHRMTIRIPKYLLNEIDSLRKKRIGSISRNLWIIEAIEKNTSKDHEK